MFLIFAVGFAIGKKSRKSQKLNPREKNTFTVIKTIIYMQNMPFVKKSKILLEDWIERRVYISRLHNLNVGKP